MAQRLCNRVGIIHGGRLIAVVTVEELRRGGAPGTGAADTAGETATDRSLEDIFLTLTGEEDLV